MPEQFPKYKLVIFNEFTLKPVFTILGGAGKFIVLGILICLALVGLGAVIFAFTPLQKIIIASDQQTDREQIMILLQQVDELEVQLENLSIYTERIQRILKMDAEVEELLPLENEPFLLDHSPITQRSSEDTLLRERIQMLDRRNPFSARFRSENISESGKAIEEVNLIKPLDGIISQRFLPELGHFGIDIVAPVNSAIKNISSGTVIWSDWTSEAGNSIAVLHAGGFVSIYKHNSQLLKKVGSFVESGEAIAIIGNTGELTDGPHLHFELWYEGRPLNPLDFFDFL